MRLKYVRVLQAQQSTKWYTKEKKITKKSFKIHKWIENLVEVHKNTNK